MVRLTEGLPVGDRKNDRDTVADRVLIAVTIVGLTEVVRDDRGVTIVGVTEPLDVF
jgi:hypothetical protein